jgi:bifunctional DNA-binding transcriptional regulator/antitoxin component of YhaV-PrlF toxin-antitoxin module
LLIPVKLRENLRILPGEEYQFYVHEENGKKYLCIEIGNSTLQNAIEVVERNGMKVSKQYP